MKIFRRTLETFCILAMMNIVLLNFWISQGISGLGSRFLAKSVMLFIIISLFLLIEILPVYQKGLKARLQILMGGYELIATSFYCLCLELVGYLLFFGLGAVPFSEMDISAQKLASPTATNTVVACFVLLLHYLNGFWRTAFCSAQLGLGQRILMLLFWWLPPVNMVLFYKWLTTVRREIIFETNKYRLDTARVENAVCQTRYPVVMVHGIFFRDWQYLNYWGRIPQALKKNGAVFYYGKQQSSRSVADSAGELKSEIERILRETGAEKVNIVAHSKGGLDARYAITHLGLADRVASLTTINTPHRGCQFADVLLGAFPKWLVNFVAARYNSLFHRLGDPAPDFLAGVNDLTATSCAALNAGTPDVPSVYYQSVMSQMRSRKSACFPLNLTYLLVKRFDGANDGLVGVDSAPWGHYLGLLTAGKKGISHGDMIDLTHKNVKGFDVSEFYVQLFLGLKEKGF